LEVRHVLKNHIYFSVRYLLSISQSHLNNYTYRKKKSGKNKYIVYTANCQFWPITN